MRKNGMGRKLGSAGAIAVVLLATCALGTCSTQPGAGTSDLTISREAQGHSAASEALVELDLFSGLPNPTWTLPRSECETLLVMIESLAPASPTLFPDRLGYRGLRVNCVLVDVGVPVKLRIYGETVEYRLGDVSDFRDDPGRQTETWLLETAQPHLDASLYAHLAREFGLGGGE